MNLLREWLYLLTIQGKVKLEPTNSLRIELGWIREALFMRRHCAIRPGESKIEVVHQFGRLLVQRDGQRNIDQQRGSRPGKEGDHKQQTDYR